MQITFTRGVGRAYSTVATCDDGVVLKVPHSDRMFSFPHDLAPFVVEEGLGLKQGFWGCVAAGALFPGMTVHAGSRTMQPSAPRRFFGKPDSAGRIKRTL